MQLEIHAWLSRVFCESSLLCDSESYREIIALSEVMKCPAHIPADYSSNLAFVVQKQKNECKENILSIEALAEELIRELSKIDQDYLKFSPSEFGHINIRLSEYAKVSFLRKLSQLSPEEFFSHKSLLFPEVTIVRVEQAEFVIKLSKLLAQAKSGEDRELKELAEKISATPVHTQDDLLMMLAACSDRELDLRAYLQSLAGKQNIPWYISCFKADILKFIKKAKKELGSKELDASDYRLHLPEQAQAALEHLLAYRGVYFNSLKADKPEVFCAFLINCMHSFYQFYNRPEFRSFELSLEAIAQLRILSKSLYHIVDQGFQKFEFEY